MQKWEYLTVTISVQHQWVANDLPIEWIGPNTTKHEVANYYGNEGWELVWSRENWIEMIFKRPVEN